MSMIDYPGKPSGRRRRKSKSPAPFIAGGVILLAVAIAAVLWVNQGRVIVKPQQPAQTGEDQLAAGVGAGPRPFVNPLDGSVGVVKDWMKENANDPDIRYVEWSALENQSKEDKPSWKGWRVTVKYRAKNGFGAWVLQRTRFLIRDGKVVDMEDF